MLKPLTEADYYALYGIIAAVGLLAGVFVLGWLAGSHGVIHG